MSYSNDSVRVFTRRGELPAGSPPSRPNRSFLRRLKGFDPALELYWNPIMQCWVCYRLVRKGINPSADYLAAISPVLRFSDSYIHWLQRNDMARKYKAGAKRAAELQDQMFKDEDYQRKRIADKEEEHIQKELARDLWKCKVNKQWHSGSITRMQNRQQKRNPKRKNVGARTGVHGAAG
mgnify:CR=1 FL=1